MRDGESWVVVVTFLHGRLIFTAADHMLLSLSLLLASLALPVSLVVLFSSLSVFLLLLLFSLSSLSSLPLLVCFFYTLNVINVVCERLSLLLT